VSRTERVSAFAGIATGGVVLSTVLQAADLDYCLSVLSDACADPDPDLHQALTVKVLSRRGDVLTSREWADSLASDLMSKE
jgi:nicotinamidase-related amidase